MQFIPIIPKSIAKYAATISRPVAWSLPRNARVAACDTTSFHCEVMRRKHPNGFWDRFPKREVIGVTVVKTRTIARWSHKEGRTQDIMETTCAYALNCGHNVTLIVKGNTERSAIPCPVCGERIEP